MGSRLASIDPKLSRLAIITATALLLIHFIYLYRTRIDTWTLRPLPPPRHVEQDERPPNKVSEPFPRKIWQTGKSGFINLSKDTTNAIRTWLKMNQNWRYEVLTDYSAETYVRSAFRNRPEIIEVYFDIADPILRADMLRYLAMLGDGGVYSDMDTVALKPIDNWIPLQYRPYTNVVVGVEYDRMDGIRWADWTLDLQFTNWAIMAKPHHPVLDLTVRKLISNIGKLALEKDTDVGHLKLSQLEILNCTGPALFTMAINEHLSRVMGHEITWLNFTKLREPTLFDDILVMPITSFGNSQPHSESGKAFEDHALVRHLFAGSWKHDRPLKSTSQQEEEWKARIDEAQGRLAHGEITSDDLIQIGKEIWLERNDEGKAGRAVLDESQRQHDAGEITDGEWVEAKKDWEQTSQEAGMKLIEDHIAQHGYAHEVAGDGNEDGEEGHRHGGETSDHNTEEEEDEELTQEEKDEAAQVNREKIEGEETRKIVEEEQVETQKQRISEEKSKKEKGKKGKGSHQKEEEEEEDEADTEED